MRGPQQQVRMEVKKEDILLRLYDSLRVECQESITHRNQIISFGIGATALLLAGGLTIDNLRVWSAICLFSIVIPLAAVAILFIWLGELHRMIRADWYLIMLEKQLCEMTKAPPSFKWHTWLVASKTQMKYPHVAVVMLFLGTAFTAPVIGAVTADEPAKGIWLMVVIPWFFLIVVAIYFYWRSKKLQDRAAWKNKLRSISELSD